MRVGLSIARPRRVPDRGTGVQTRGMAEDRDAARFYALRTFRVDGSAVMTPVWAAFDGDSGFVLTGSRTFKVRRIARNARVEIAPSDFRGALKGAWCAGVARVTDTVTHRRALALLGRKYGLQFHMFRAASALGRLRADVGGSVTLAIELERPQTVEATDVS